MSIINGLLSIFHTKKSLKPNTFIFSNDINPINIYNKFAHDIQIASGAELSDPKPPEILDGNLVIDVFFVSLFLKWLSDNKIDYVSNTTITPYRHEISKFFVGGD